MKDTKRTPKAGRSVPKVSQALVWDGRTYRLEETPTGTYRLRSRSRSHPVNIGLGTTCVNTARRNALEILEGKREVLQRGGETVADLIQCYLTELPRRANEDAAREAAQSLRRVIALAWGKEPAEVRVHELSSQLWLDYARKRQGGRLDLATRRAGNSAINSALRCAASALAPKLAAAYKLAGYTVPPCPVQWLPVTERRKQAMDETRMLSAWAALKGTAPDMWMCIGLARFAGLRLSEITACRGNWLEGASIAMRDRESEGYWTKTGKSYKAPVLNPELLVALQSADPGKPVINRAPNWYARAPQAWLRQWVSDRLPLHRLRGLYADQLAELERDAVAARQAGILAASQALGHTTTHTTETSYLSKQL